MSLITRLRSWVSRIPTAWLAVLTAVGVALVIGSGIFLYRTYQFVEHDNDFCLSCHLMADPYERFAQSAHRGLGCKACHKPSFAGRSRMALRQILEQPDTLAAHAEVPNEKCASCHIEGDPEEWRLISSSAGHRVHLESADPSLQGLMCVECHSSSVHEFAATPKTCGQSGCHSEAETDIQLGAMGKLTIHCIACHDFSRPVGDDMAADTLAVALRPQREQCLSCHEMRRLVGDMPADEPHNAVCGACHNPHEQPTPHAAVESCASSGCHTSPDTLTSMHRGLDPGVLENCTTCHTAHEFRIERTDCLACHQGVFDDLARQVTSPADRRSATLPAGHPPMAGAGMLPDLYAALAHTEDDAAAPAGSGRASLLVHPVPPRGPAAAVQDTGRFAHGDHRGVECTACHTSERTHGGLTVTGLTDCRSCHHTEPVVRRCSACHQPREYAGRTYGRAQTFQLSVGRTDPTRTLDFDHRRHDDIGCTECHRGGLALGAADVRCSSCHEEHHQPDRACIACHVDPAQGAHPVSVHVTGCAGSGCHEAVPPALRGVPRTRSFCLACHQEQREHMVGGNCADCHRLPAPRVAGGGDR